MQTLLVINWLLMIAVLMAVGAPIAALLFPQFPGRGAAFSLPIALLSLALVTFWIGQGSFGSHTVLVALLVTAGVSLLAYRHGATPDWQAVATTAPVFVCGFLFLLIFRVYNPTVSQFRGEQFLHFGIVNALARTSALPPEDIWFAGEPLRYYYGSQLQVTALSLLSGTPLQYGFNLGIATFYGVLVVSAYGLAGAIADAHGRSARVGGVLGTFFVAVGGATTTAIRLAIGRLPDETALAYGRPAFAGLAENRGNYAERVATQSDPGEWTWFFVREVVPGTLQEFPLYSFIKADLHGHTLSTGYIIVAGALTFAYYRTPTDQHWRRRGLVFGALGVVAGVFGFMNTWSLPTAVGLAWLALAAADGHPATLLPASVADRLTGPPITDDMSTVTRIGAEGWRLILAAAFAVSIGFIGVLIASPFLVFGDVPTNEGIGLFPPRSQLGPFLVIYGGLLTLFTGFLIWRGRSTIPPEDHRRVAIAALVGTSAIGIAAIVLAAPVVAVTVPLLVGAWWLVRTDRAGFAAVLLIAGVGLVLSMEVVFAKVYHWEEAGASWETSLKVAVQGWTVMGVAAGAIATLMLGGARDRLRDWQPGDSARATAERTVRSVGSTVLLVGLVLGVVVASSPFVVLAVGEQIREPVSDPNNEPTLDALDGQDRWHDAEMEAINWLDKREQAPTIVEMSVAGRQRPGRVSSFTGLPTVLGWANHQEKFRGADPIETRTEQVEAVYEGPWDDAKATLQAHDVQYIFVGEMEYKTYSDLEGRFADRSALSVVFENDRVTIYAVDQSALTTEA